MNNPTLADLSTDDDTVLSTELDASDLLPLVDDDDDDADVAPEYSDEVTDAYAFLAGVSDDDDDDDANAWSD